MSCERGNRNNLGTACANQGQRRTRVRIMLVAMCRFSSCVPLRILASAVAHVVMAETLFVFIVAKANQQHSLHITKTIVFVPRCAPPTYCSNTIQCICRRCVLLSKIDDCLLVGGAGPSKHLRFQGKRVHFPWPTCPRNVQPATAGITGAAAYRHGLM